MPGGVSIQRITRPAVEFGFADDEVLGGQHPWVWATGLPYRALAAPLSGAVMPQSPRALLQRNEYGHVEGDFDHAIGYFAALQSFLTYSFGWTRHDKGLIWWLDQGAPAADPRFGLIRDVWLGDGMLEHYLSWCVEHFHIGVFDAFEHVVDDQPLELSPDWRARLGAIRTQRDVDDPSLRPDQMHLQDGKHIGGPSMGPADARLIAVDPGSRSAVLISQAVSGWCAALMRLGSALPALPGGRSWCVDVHVKPVGFLGTFRRSRATGLWFAGRHAHHIVGN